MTDEAEKLSKRITDLENKLRMTFMEVERRFDILREKHMDHDIESRLTEIEDLLLLLQLEVTKIKDMAGVAVDIGLTPDTPPLSERLNRLEHEMSAFTSRGTAPEETLEDLETPPLIEENKEPQEPAAETGSFPERKKKKEAGLMEDVNRILGLKAHA